MVALASAVACCGYPVDPDAWIPDFGIVGDPGAIAFIPQEFRAALDARYLSQEEADSGALERCGKGCEVVLRFEGHKMCGSLASGTNQFVGIGSGRPRDMADGAALVDCQAKGGVECAISLDGCNN